MQASASKQNAFDVLEERGLIAQTTNSEAIREMLDEGPIKFYIGFDNTARSLHAGSLVPIMAMMHLQRAGHHPIALVGTGTTMIGDPSGRDDIRRMMDEETIREYGSCIHKQLGHYLDFEAGRSTPVDNADWLLNLSLVPFLRDIGKHFSVNRMLAAEGYKIRWERGLNFIELNYQILQAYDFLHLYREHGCMLQCGGDDQWSNILAGVDLIRRVEGKTVHALTYPLLTTSDGKKMGKSRGGAIWLDGEMLPAFDYYQYWINCTDADVGRFLRTFTFLPLDEISRLEALQGADIREAKRVLAFEATKITHGEDAAKQAEAGAGVAFDGGAGGDFDAMPTTAISQERLDAGISVPSLFTEVGLTGSNGEAKRHIKGGALRINDEKIGDLSRMVNASDMQENGIILAMGKKKKHRLIVES